MRGVIIGTSSWESCYDLPVMLQQHHKNNAVHLFVKQNIVTSITAIRRKGQGFPAPLRPHETRTDYE